MGPASWARISSASMPPTTKNTIAATPYMMPRRLWSTVNTHDRHPVAATGRRNTPSALDGATTDGSRAGVVAGVAGTGRSMMAISVQP